jgi:hypothetical protein
MAASIDLGDLFFSGYIASAGVLGGAVVRLGHLDFLNFSRPSFLDPRNHPQRSDALLRGTVEARLPLPSVARALMKRSR